MWLSPRRPARRRRFPWAPVDYSPLIGECAALLISLRHGDLDAYYPSGIRPVALAPTRALSATKMLVEFFQSFRTRSQFLLMAILVGFVAFEISFQMRPSGEADR